MKRHFHFTLYIMLLILFYLIIISCSQNQSLKDINITGPLGEVTLKTDKTEYERGETIQIIVYNGLNETVALDGGGGCQGYPYVISKYENGNWKNLPSSCGGCKVIFMTVVNATNGNLLLWDQKIFERPPYSCRKIRVISGVYKIKTWARNQGIVESNEFKIR